MKAFKILTFSIIVLLLAFILMPVNKEDLPGLAIDEIECAKNAAYLMFDNIIERGLIKDIAVTNKDGKNIYATSYTFGGIPLSVIEANCPGGSAKRL